MPSDRSPPLAVPELVEYCRTQAGLLAGHVERLSEEASDLLDEIDDEMADIRSRLDGGAADVGTTAGPSSTTRPNEREVDLDSIEALERDLSEKQTLVDAKQARMQAFQELAAAYTELAETLHAEVDDGQEALTRVIEFEADNDAPVYFDERQTLCEAAIDAQGDGDSTVEAGDGCSTDESP